MRRNIFFSLMLIFFCSFYSCSSDDSSTKEMVSKTENLDNSWRRGIFPWMPPALA